MDLRDPIWQFWGAIIGFVGIVIAIAIFLFQRKTRKLVYAVLTETPLLSVHESISGKIEIKYEGKPVHNIFLVVLKLENVGNDDIPASDFEQPININFPNSQILSAKLFEASPNNLRPKISHRSSSLTIKPVMLNKRDYVTLKLLFWKYEKTIEVDARILGVTIERVYNSKRRSSKERLSLRWARRKKQ